MWTDEEPDMLSIRMADLLCGYYAAEERVVVHCSTDLSTVDTVNHPDELFKTLARFYKSALFSSCYDRLLSSIFFLFVD